MQTKENKIENENKVEENKEKKTMNLKDIKTYKDFIENLDKIEWLQFFSRNFKKVVKSIEDPQVVVADMEGSYNKYLHELMVVYLGSLFYKREFKKIYNFVKQVDLSGEKKKYDLFYSKMIKYYYWSAIELDCCDIDEFHCLFNKNVQHENTHSVLVLNNVLLNFYMEKRVDYLDLVLKNVNFFGFNSHLNDVNELAMFYFNLGFSNLILGDYSSSLKYFDEADILNRYSTFSLNITKCTIVCKLLLGELNILYDYQKELAPYFMLIGIVKRGEIHKLDELLEEHKEEFNNRMKLFLIIKRLVSNVLKEGIRKIGIVYAKVSLNDINKIFMKDVSCLVHKVVLDGEIDSEIVKINNELYLVKKTSANKTKNNYNINDAIKRIINIREHIKKQMVYPDIPVLTYERLRDEETELIEKYDL